MALQVLLYDTDSQLAVDLIEVDELQCIMQDVIQGLDHDLKSLVHEEDIAIHKELRSKRQQQLDIIVKAIEEGVTDGTQAR